MSARVIDFLGLRRGIAKSIEAIVPGVQTHWENQNQPAPQGSPYVSLSLLSGFMGLALPQEKKVTSLTSVIITIPDPLPLVGNFVWILIDGWEPFPRHEISFGNTPSDVRDSLLQQIQELNPVKYGGLFQAAAQGTNQILLTPLQLGGLLEVLGKGGITVASDTEVVLYSTMPFRFRLRMQCFGTSSTTATDFSSVGFDHPSSIWATISLKMRSRSFARLLYENATAFLWGYPEGGQDVPSMVWAGIEPRTVGEVVMATQALNFETLPMEVQHIFVNNLNMNVDEFQLQFDFNKDTQHQLLKLDG